MAERLEKQNLWLEGRWSHQQINKNFGWPLLVSTLITTIEGPVSKDPMSKAPKSWLALWALLKPLYLAGIVSVNYEYNWSNIEKLFPQGEHKLTKTSPQHKNV